jgi:hypothetical protein
MNRITFPIGVDSQGQALTDLQSGLRFLIDDDFFGFNEDKRRAAIAGLDEESLHNKYGATTKDLVALFQKASAIDVTGFVDEKTAVTLNEKLEARGAFDQSGAQAQRVVAGLVRRQSGEPIPDLLVRAFHVGEGGSLRLGSDTTDPDGGYTIPYTMPPGLAAIKLRVVAYLEKEIVADSGLLPDAQPLQFVTLTASGTQGLGEPQFTVSGHVISASSAGVGGLIIHIVDKGVGPDFPLTEAATDADGAYLATFPAGRLANRNKPRPDIQVLVFRGDEFLGASEVRYQAAEIEVLDVRLTKARSEALPSEHEALASSLAEVFPGSLAGLEETEERQDITFLANRSGWDARAVALASLGELSSSAAAQAGEEIEPALFYALFRAGVPADEGGLYSLDSAAAGNIWKQAIAQGVIPASLEARLPQAQDAFQKLVAQRALERPPAAGLSPLKELLNISVPPDTDPQEQQAKQVRLADLLTRHRDDTDALWAAIQGEFGAEVEQRMRLDGKLARLTGSNAPLMQRLHARAGGRMDDAIQLVDLGFYKAGKWQEAVTDIPVPPDIPGQDEAEKRARYAELLAMQVRLSFPTATISQMVADREMLLFDAGGQEISQETRTGIHQFLTSQQSKFELGVQPVEQYVQQNDVTLDPAVKHEIIRMQRVLQMTPSNEAMAALLAENVDSANKVVHYSRAEFVRAFKDKVGGEAEAGLIHARARQVYDVALNIVVAYGSALGAPGVGVTSTLPVDGVAGPQAPGRIINPAPPNSSIVDSGVLALPTLENLFGSLDFCDCDHCRSMLSPAAYLVDLLHFIDRDDAVWVEKLAQWQADHGNAPYPFESPEAFNAAGQPANTEVTPLQVLLGRRPDLEHLPLTCENTNTPLPYIDLVNEILESFVANGSLVGYEGHTTDGSVAVEELLANPQFVAREAYTSLAKTHFPPPLPFDQPLESVRRYLDHFQAPLAQVMEALRKNEALERASESEYGWRDILIEELRLNREEYLLLTDHTLPLLDLYGFPSGTSADEVLAVLSNARTFARRMNISYAELLDILKTRFVNPASTLIPRLERLGVTLAMLSDLRQKLIDAAITPEQFRAELAPGIDESQYGGDVVTWIKDEAHFKAILGLLTLTGPDAASDCSFEKLQFRYADPAKADEFVKPLEFVRLLRFIRLWRKLGWSIEDTDKAIAAFYPAEQMPDAEEPNDAALVKLDEGFLILLPRLGVFRRVVRALKLNLKKDLLPALALFAPLDTHGDSSLYRLLFLGPALAQQDEVFADNGFGDFLSKDAKLLDHTEALRAAFNLTGEELALILAALRFDAETPLTLENISAILRRGWLARKLKLSVAEFLLLTEQTGLDPFAPPDPPDPSLTPPRGVAPIELLIELLEQLRAVALKPAQALYLFWHQDIGGRSTPEESEILDFARSLRASLAVIDQDFAVVDDPSGEIARARMALVYGSEAMDLYFSLLDRAFTTEVQYDHQAPLLEQAILDVAPAQIGYDDFRKRLSFKGLMSEPVRDALKAASSTGDFQSKVDDLFTANRKLLDPFFARYPELRPLHDDFVNSARPSEEKRANLLRRVVADLTRRRKQEQAAQAVTAAAGVEVEFGRAILDTKPEFAVSVFAADPVPVYVLHASGDPERPALDDLVAAEQHGLSVKFFFGDQPSGDPDLTREGEAKLIYNANVNPLPQNTSVPGGKIIGVWSGYLEIPEDDSYNVAIEADLGATVTLTLGNASVELDHDQEPAIFRNVGELALRAGTLYRFVLTVGNVKDKVTVRWATASRGQEPIPAQLLYGDTGMAALRDVYLRFLKAASLAEALKLDANELAYLAAHPNYRIGQQGWLNEVPTKSIPADEIAPELPAVLDALVAFARFKAAFGGEDDALLSVIRNPPAEPGPDDPLLALTRWEAPSLDALLARFGRERKELVDPLAFRQLDDAMALVRQTGTGAAQLIAAATNLPQMETAASLQSALRARFTASDWLNTVKTINDELRAAQRDALVSHILQGLRADPATKHIDTPDKLFEYFLMDVQMEPCTMTSRIRHALSSVQLFIERSLMNLEPGVSPQVLDAKQWEWMSRYRVWEANRKVFLFPENWLEPELRDDQSPFFKETMSDLLQGDVTADSAEIALLNYLAKLDDVAKLEPCGVYYEEDDTTTEINDDVIHVVARTSGTSRKYYYTSRQDGFWKPWEAIRLDIEDNPVIPVVWKGRLLLFWLKILQDTKVNPDEMPTTVSGDGALGGLSLGAVKRDAKAGAQQVVKVTVKAILGWSEYYNGKWQPARSSDINKAVKIGEFAPNVFDRSQLRLSVYDKETGNARGPLVVEIMRGGLSVLERFILHNTHSLPEQSMLLSQPNDAIRSLSTGGQLFVASYDQVRFQDEFNMLPRLVRPILRNRTGDVMSAVGPLHDHLKSPWDAPFFVGDSRHLFFVTTTRRAVRIPTNGGFVPPVLLQQAAVQLPPLLQLDRPVTERPVPIIDPTDTQAGFGVINTGAVKTFVSEDVYIHKGIGTAGTVRIGKTEIGPAGGLFNGEFRE